MIPRTVLRIEPDGPDALQRRLKVEEVAATAFDKIFGLPFRLKIEDLPTWDGNGVALKYGTALYRALTDHPGVKEAITLALNPPAGEVRPIYFYLDTADSELFCWETLCDDKGKFLALNSPQWPIGRIANSPVSPASLPHDFAPPLKLMAVISALGPTDLEQSWDQQEWQRLYQTIKARRGADFPIKLRVIVGQEPLLEIVRMAQASDPDLEVLTVPESAFKLRKQIETFAPHFLHFFCHGTNDGAGPRLDLAQVTDWDQAPNSPQRVSSVKMALDDILQIPGLTNIWLVTLNCCEGSKATKTEWSLTHSLVARGVPAAVGMLEEIDPNDSHEFCESFYNAALACLVQAYHRVRQNNNTEPIEWTAALWDSRCALNAPNRIGRNKQPAWTLPVIYVRRNPFQFRAAAGPSPGAGETLEAFVRNGLRDLLHPSYADSPEVAKLLARLRSAPAPAGN